MSTDNREFDGYRPNVGIIVCNDQAQVLWARRVRHDGWQFPQGGIKPTETPQEAAFRELQEEVGLSENDVKLLGSTEKWFKYDVPYAARSYLHQNDRKFRGQIQRWFLFKLISNASCVQLNVTDTPEFDHWKWIDYWQPIEKIVKFKRSVYQQALTELEPLLKQI